MKKTIKFISLLFVFTFYTLSIFAQSAKEFFDNKDASLTYLGVDYMKAKLFGLSSTDASDFKSRIFSAINELSINEPKNFKVAEALRHSNVINNLKGVKARNEKIKEADLLTTNLADMKRLSETDIATEVKAINFEDTKGVGLIFIMEGMKKGDKDTKVKADKASYGSVWATLIDIKTKKVILTERFEEEANGFGPRNFWASIIKKAINDVDDKYKSWSKKTN